MAYPIELSHIANHADISGHRLGIPYPSADATVVQIECANEGCQMMLEYNLFTRVPELHQEGLTRACPYVGQG